MLARRQAIEAALREYDIDDGMRMAAFLAQIGHESAGLHYALEIWGPTVAQHGYEGRADLGNTQPGDGFRYRGRGLIQVTGRANYAKASEALGLDFVAQPELLEQPEYAARSAAWYWHAHGLNELADVGDFMTITRKINGGTNGYADRLRLYEAGKHALGVV